jgi:hypothetical protein
MENAMKLIDGTQPRLTPNPSLKDRCVLSCRKLLAQLAQTKDSLLKEFRQRLASKEHLLYLALNEAEALAWQSGVPQLVFLTLAREKAEAVAGWHARQQSLRRTSASALAPRT